MNWQETVIDMSSVENKSLRVAMVSILRQQAEASFKAGHEEGRKGCPALEVQGQIYLEGKEAGIREAIAQLHVAVTVTAGHPEFHLASESIDQLLALLEPQTLTTEEAEILMMCLGNEFTRRYGKLNEYAPLYLKLQRIAEGDGGDMT